MNATAIRALDPTEIHLHRFGNGTPLVLLHSLGMDHHQWGCLNPLRDHYEMVSYDLPGHGATPAPPHGYTIAELSEQLHGILE
jgi:pimeloyl-ACP methyl ester carboxylesterase